MSIRERFFAATYDAIWARNEKTWMGAYRGRLLADAKGTVLEIGGGTGANLAHYRDVDAVFVTEPVAPMLDRLQPRLVDAHVPVTLARAGAEALPFPDASFDTVVSTLVLCSVADPRRSARELHRVLRPGGMLLFIEHGGAGARRGVWQRRVEPIWKQFAGGCHLTRHAVSILEDEGFTVGDVDDKEPKMVPGFLMPFRVGTASR
jgi:ubiquinone/menaquinone biosynthesis C-methylase UbiE